MAGSHHVLGRAIRRKSSTVARSAQRCASPLLASLPSVVGLALAAAGCAPASTWPDRDDTASEARAADACDPYEPRSVAPEVLVGPEDFEPALLDLVASAQTSIDVLIYQLSRPSFVSAFAAAAKRGVAVRILVDPDEGLTASQASKLAAAGVAIADAPASFAHAHSKVLVVDGDRAAILSGNLDYHTMVTERNYGVVDAAPDDVADAHAIFEHDWSGAPLDLGCTRLVVSPDNARQRLAAHVKRAKNRLDLAVMYLSDATVLAAVKARASAGVPVRVLLASPYWIPGNAQTQKALVAAGAQARFFTEYELHAKLVLSDGAAFVGSENMSYTSLKKNREVGVFVTEPEAVAPIDAQFEADWADGWLP